MATNVGNASQPVTVSCRNYYLLIVFFALATLYSLLDLRRQQRMWDGPHPAGNATVNGLGYAVVTLFHINLTVHLTCCSDSATPNMTLNVLRLVLIVTDCAHSGYANMDPAMADVEEEPRPRAVSFLCASALQLHKLQPGKACCDC